MLFVDNAGADVVLGMLPLARELLCNGAQVVMAANSIPAINDVTADELVALLAEVWRVAHVPFVPCSMTACVVLAWQP